MHKCTISQYIGVCFEKALTKTASKIFILELVGNTSTEQVRMLS